MTPLMMSAIPSIAPQSNFCPSHIQLTITVNDKPNPDQIAEAIATGIVFRTSDKRKREIP